MVREVIQSFKFTRLMSLSCHLCKKGVEWWTIFFFNSVNGHGNCGLAICNGGGVAYCQNNSIKDWMLGWIGLCHLKGCRRVWNTLFFTMIWSIWEVHNELVFKDKATSLVEVMD